MNALPESPYEKALAKQEKVRRRRVCILAHVCPDCGSDMTDTWTETHKSWFGLGAPRQVVVTPHSRSCDDPFDYVKCLPCNKEYIL